MDAPEADVAVADAIYQYGASRITGADEIIVLCIGTDRSIGDALGPLVGSYLTETHQPDIVVRGTLDHPVHASNLQENLDWIHRNYLNPLIVAVDACLGRSESIGLLTVGRGSLKPGAGVNKSLPPVGHIYVTGVVNVGGFMEYFVLQNTRLNLVVKMAKTTANGVKRGVAALAKMRVEGDQCKRTNAGSKM